MNRKVVVTIFTLFYFCFTCFAQPDFDELDKSVVVVNIYDKEGYKIGHGSAFVIDKSGILISNYHVFETGYDFDVLFKNGETYPVDKLLKGSPQNDIITFSIKLPSNKSIVAIPISKSKVKKGQKCYAVGTPAEIAYMNTVSEGIISNIYPDGIDDWTGYMYQVTAPYSSGSSGGVLLNQNGVAVAVTVGGDVSKDGSRANINWAISLSEIDNLSTINDQRLVEEVELKSTVSFYTIDPFVNEAFIYIRGIYVGRLTGLDFPLNNPNCGAKGTLNIDLFPGQYSYSVVFPESGLKQNGLLNIKGDSECYTVKVEKEVKYSYSSVYSMLEDVNNDLNKYISSDNETYLLQAHLKFESGQTIYDVSENKNFLLVGGRIFYFLHQEINNISGLITDPLLTSSDFFLIALETKKLSKSEINTCIIYLQQIAAETFNYGLELYNSGSYLISYKYFKKVNTISNALERTKKNLELEFNEDALHNAALAITQADQGPLAVPIYEELIFEEPTNEAAYARLANLYKELGQTGKAQEVIAKGLEANPNSMILLTEDINFYLEDGKAVEAKEKILKAVEMDPENISLQMVRGDVHVQLLEWDDAIVAYEAAAALDDADFRPHFNMGIVYTKQADLMIEEMNSLGYSDEDKARYEELDAERTELFKKAYPHIQKAAELEPDNDAVQRALTQVGAKMK